LLELLQRLVEIAGAEDLAQRSRGVMITPKW